MTVHTRQKEMYDNDVGHTALALGMTIGVVVDTNDPQQAGRVRAACVQLGDILTAPLEDIPWAVYISPFGGQVAIGTRGPGIETSEGNISYGMWAIPKVGAKVLVSCIDGDRRHRAYLGCMYNQFTAHTMPHGRWMYEDHPALEKSGEAVPYGPFTSREKQIHPLTENFAAAFGTERANFERQTRAADYSVSRVDVSQLGATISSVQDDKDVVVDNWTSTQGYQQSRIDPHAHTSYTDKNYDNMVTAITSPGFHAFSMDDRQENNRVRIRTSSGSQFLMDDTNERIYMMPARGHSWFEMDWNGNVDVFSANKVNVHSIGTLNLTSDADVRIHGGKGVHISSGDVLNITSVADTSIGSTAALRMTGNSGAFLQGSVVNVLASGGNANVSASGNINLGASGDLIGSASTIHLNGPSAEPASSAESKTAAFPNRIPQHEPWARGMTKDDRTMEPELSYDSPLVNRVERGVRYTRGYYWRR